MWDTPTHTNISTNSDLEIEINGTPSSPATNFAKRIYNKIMIRIHIY